MLRRYFNWLHGKWPARQIESLPVLDANFETSQPGLFVVGDLTGIPLLKFAADSAARVVDHISTRPRSSGSKQYDLVIIGGGVSGISAAIEAKRKNLSFIVLESDRPLSTIENFPLAKPILTYPRNMVPTGGLRIEGHTRETLLDSLRAQAAPIKDAFLSGTAEQIERTSEGFAVHLVPVEDDTPAPLSARFVVIAIGRSGQYETLGVPGEELEHVSNRLHDPTSFTQTECLVVGGSDGAVETAVALAKNGAAVTLSYRSEDLTRPKSENLDALNRLKPKHESTQSGEIRCLGDSQIESIQRDTVQLKVAGVSQTLSAQAVFPMIGRKAPLDFFRRSKIALTGEWRMQSVLTLVAFFSFCVFLYQWKSYNWFPFAWLDPSTWFDAHTHNTTDFMYTLLSSAQKPSFYYTLIYSLVIGIFGWRRIQRRQTPYVKYQTISLLLFQWIPLFVLPEIILPWAGRNHAFVEGAMMRPFADSFFESYDQGLGVERAYWRAYGFILAWPLMVYNWFTEQPMAGWLVVGGIQTFVLIPLLVFRWGKGAYCGWICSCGALAETLGDTHRQKMPHGGGWNKLNMLGQFILFTAFLMFALRVWGWIHPGSWADENFNHLLYGNHTLSYQWLVDVALAGFVGVGLYFHYSGRVWCRFACPLAALMNIYARFSRFRIFSKKEHCISCGVCTSVCHQGIDVMTFANRGQPMNDPQCVRCSACVSSCPTNVLKFGRLSATEDPIYDRTPAALLAMIDRLENT